MIFVACISCHPSQIGYSGDSVRLRNPHRKSHSDHGLPSDRDVGTFPARSLSPRASLDDSVDSPIKSKTLKRCSDNNSPNLQDTDSSTGLCCSFHAEYINSGSGACIDASEFECGFGGIAPAVYAQICQSFAGL